MLPTREGGKEASARVIRPKRRSAKHSVQDYRGGQHESVHQALEPDGSLAPEGQHQEEQKKQKRFADF